MSKYKYTKVADRKPGVQYDHNGFEVQQAQEQAKPINVVYTPRGSQIDVWYALQDKTTVEILHAGVVNAGKTFNAVAWIAMYAVLYPGSRWLIGRTKLSDLEGTTLKTLFKLFAEWNIPESTYNYNKQDHVLTLWNKSEIILKDLAFMPSDPLYSRLGGYEICGAYIDEANLIDVLAKNIILSRIRYKLKEYGLTPKLLLTSNPGSGFVREQFYEPFVNGTLPAHRKFFPCAFDDNPEQDASYLETIDRLDDISRKRLYLGLWDYSSDYTLIKYDAILDMFNLPASASTNGDYYLSIDVARLGKDSTVIFLWNDYNVIDIFSLDKSRINETHEKVQQLINKYNIPLRNIIIDTDGVGGGLADLLKGCIEFQNNARALSKENFQNAKTQCYYKLADFINERKIKIFNCPSESKTFLIKELEVIKADKVDKDTKLCIISKDEIKRMIGRSPDFSDAMMMRMYYSISSKLITGEYFVMSGRLGTNR